VAERNEGDIGLSAGWQGDNSGNTVPGPNNDYVVVPVAKNPDGSAVTGLAMGRIVNASGVNSQGMFVHSNPVPYRPASLDTKKATLTTHASESIEGDIGKTATIKSGDWAWASCSASNPFPGTPDPTQICLKNGFNPKLLYQVVFTAKDPYVLGIGFAAFRDVAAFFKHAAKDDVGTPNPLAGGVSWIIGRGVSQSGNFLRAFLHLGFNQDEAGRQVYEGAWPIIAGRRAALNFRFAMPDGVLKLYEPGSEGPQWWVAWPDPVRNLPTRGILDRCDATGTCPKIIEHFGAAEVWGLKLTPEWVGTAADADIPLTDAIRRYYLPSTQHGGGNGGFSVTPLMAPSCPSMNYGMGTFAANPVPHTETVNAIRSHFRKWVMNGTPPPPSRYPTLGGHNVGGHASPNAPEGNLVDATKEDMGFPTIPGVPLSAPTSLINPVIEYDFGSRFDYSDASGIQTVMPPKVKQVIRMLVPRVDADGNELGGVPVVLRDAPLGTYLGWNITAGGFHQGKICNYAGGMIPFAKTRAERLAAGDPRLSLEERYRTHAGYVAAVQAAAANAVAQGFLLQTDADALVAQAAAGNVLNP
jgi:Alpha/beta hydrolase domain